MSASSEWVLGPTTGGYDGSPDEPPRCLACGHEVVEDLVFIDAGTWVETVCRDPWGCWLRQAESRATI